MLDKDKVDTTYGLQIKTKRKGKKKETRGKRRKTGRLGNCTFYNNHKNWVGNMFSLV
jgi:hypothetical protein